MPTSPNGWRWSPAPAAASAPRSALAWLADLTLAVLRNGYMTNTVVSIDGGIYPR